MNTDILQTKRYALQKRVRRLNSTRSEPRYVMGLRQYWRYLKADPLLWGVVADLKQGWPHVPEQIAPLLRAETQFAPATEEEQAALAVALIQYCVETANDSPVYEVSYRLGRTGGSGISEYVEQFHELVTEPLYEYIDEKLDSGRAVLGLLVRYKHRCEWFARERLFEEWVASKGTGEKALAKDLYHFLFDQGLDFAIEPASASGEADLVSAQVGDEKLVADAKVFDPASGKDRSYLARGVNQLYVYTQDYNQPIGYLVVFKTCETDLRLVLTENASGIPLLSHNNKTLFILVVDIYPHPTSASKRGKLSVVEVKESDLLRQVEA